MMPNTSATGGYILGTATALPGGLTLNQYIHQILVGVTGITGSLVRPEFQEAPPAQPDASVDWIAFGVFTFNPDANAYVGLASNDTYVMQRHSDVEVRCSFYGPNSLSIAEAVRDNLQIPQNGDAFRAANMGFVSTGAILLVPDLVNERFINRQTMSIFLRRETVKTFPVLPVLSADGTIKANSGERTTEVDWQVEE